MLFEISIMYEIGHRPKSCEIIITLLYFISLNVGFYSFFLSFSQKYFAGKIEAKNLIAK